MYQFSYPEIQTASIADARERERQLLDRSIELLSIAREKGAGTAASSEALQFLDRVWTVFIEDLGTSDNQLPRELRANLTSIGLWLIREAEAVRQGRSKNFEGLIDVSRIIRDGMR